MADDPITYVGDPWERQPFDTDKSFIAFQQYLILGPGRTTDRAGNLLGYKQGQHLRKWSMVHHWRDRCRLWEDHLAAQRRDQISERAKTEMASFVDKEMKTANALRRASVEMLILINQSLTQLRTDGHKLTPSEIATFLTAATRAAGQAELTESHILGVYELMAALDE